MPSDPSSARDALRLLRAHHAGLLLVDEEYLPRRYVLDPASGLPVVTLPARSVAGVRIPPPGADESMVFHVPDEGEDAVQLLVTPRPLVAGTGRIVHEAYHGRSEDSIWVALDVETVRWPGGVASGSEVIAPNPLAASVAAILRSAIPDPGALLASARRTGGAIHAVAACGVDPDGLDLRTNLGILRLAFEHPALGESDAIESARRAIAGWAGDRA